MRVIPVLDLMNGQVVRGVAGQRQDYRPIVSKLTKSTRPLDVAHAFRGHFQVDELYVADLDAIAGGPPLLMVYQELVQAGFRLWVDAGGHFEKLALVGVTTFVAGLESLAGPRELAKMLQDFGPARVVFSLDLKDGQPLGRLDAWHAGDAWAIAKQAVDLGAARMLVLDLAGVGVGAGSKTADFCTRLRRLHFDLDIATGGGVRGKDDLVRLRDAGVDAVLVASALHDGKLSAKDMSL